MWPTETAGEAASAETDEDGIARLWYPENVGSKPEIKSVGEVSVEVTHRNFVSDYRDYSVNHDGAVALTPGHSMTITAATYNLDVVQPVKRFAVTPSYGDSLAQWSAKEGELTTNSMQQKGETVLLATTGEQRPRLFSDPIKIDRRLLRHGRFDAVPLSAGIRVEGDLDSNVPRPVVKGLVVAAVRFEEPKRLHWYDFAEVNPDGTFVIESMPRGSEVQFIAYAEGWHSASDGTDRGFIHGMKYRVSGPTAKPTIPMQESAKLTVLVLDENDKPVPGINVLTWPNQRWFGWGAEHAGAANRSSEWLQGDVINQDGEELEEWLDFSATTNQQGVAQLKNVLNVLAYVDVAIDSENYILPENDSSETFPTSFDVRPGETKDVTIHVRRVD